MNIRNFGFLAVATILFFTSCSNEDDDDKVVPKGDYENGILVLNEGNFGQGNASVSFVSFDLETVENSVFSNVNSEPLGDTAQSMSFNGDLAFIVLNVSNKIEIVNRYTFKSVASITSGLNNPRYIAFSNGKGFVTNWGDGSNPDDDYVAIIDLNTNTLESDVISVVEGPEKIIASGNTIYVAQQGGFSQNNKVTVIDAVSNSVSITLEVGDVPNSLQLDDSGSLWVLCGGKPAWTGSETGGKLFKINTSDNSSNALDFSSTEHPNSLSIENNDLFYYSGGSVFKMNNSATTLPTNSEMSGLNFYEMTVENNILYGTDAKDFASQGDLSSYDLSSNTLINTAAVDIIPGGIYFN